PRLHLALDDLDARRFQYRRDGVERRAARLDRRAGDARRRHPVGPCQSAARRRDGDVGAAGADPARRPVDAPAATARGAAVSVATVSVAAPRRPNYRLQRRLKEAGSLGLGLVLLIWWFLPLYNMVLIAIDPN